MLREGAVLAGHRLIERVGEGHYGEVWKAEYQGRPVAVKIFNRPYRLSNVRREALAQYALGRLPGPDARYFPRVEHIDFDAAPPLVRMEFIEGVPLEQVITNPAVTLDDRLAIGGQILRALSIVHANGFVHGDLSPMNALVASRGDHREVKLIDVGFGAMLDDEPHGEMSRSDSSERPMGVASPLYAAPERFKSEFLNGCGKSSDIFSFGKILYRLVTGESPFLVKPVTMKFPDFGVAWDAFIFKCLEERPEARFRDAGEALAVFEKLPRVTRVPQPYRTECPGCGARMDVAPVGVGDRLTCVSCGRAMEILFLDEAEGYASTVGAAEPAVVADPQAVKFCPSCGERIRVQARKCRFCGVWVDEYARALEQRARERVRAAEVASLRHRRFYAESLVTLLAYPLCWLPGLIMNVHFLGEASRVEKVVGRPAPGAGFLHLMIWLFFYMPLIFIVSVIGFGALVALLS